MEEEKQNKNTPSLQEVINNSGVLKEKPTEENISSFKKYSSILKPLRTYQGDVAEIIAGTKHGEMPEPKPIQKLEEKPAPKIEEKPEPKPAQRPEEKPWLKFSARSEEKPLQNLEPKPIIQPEEKPAPKISLVSIAMAAQKKREEGTETFPEAEEESVNHDVRNKIFILVGLVLFVAGALTLGLTYYFNSQNNVQTISQANTIIGYSDSINFPISGATRDNLMGTITQNQKSFNKPVNAILYIDMTTKKGVASTTDVLILLAPNMPAELERNLTDQYMIGIYSFDTNQPFIIFKTDDYGASFAGMLRWESTMIYDLGQIFGIPSLTETSVPYAFSDEALQNKDLRVVKDKAGKTVMLYSLIDKNTIVITGSENVFKAIVSKYMNSKTVR